MIRRIVIDLTPLLPGGTNGSFRERLVAHIEHPPVNADADAAYGVFRAKADALLRVYETVFGVNDLLEGG